MSFTEDAVGLIQNNLNRTVICSSVSRLTETYWTYWSSEASSHRKANDSIASADCVFNEAEEWVKYVTYCLSIVPQPFVGPWPLFQFLDLFTQSVGPLGRGISSSQSRYLHTGQHKQNKRTQTSIPQVRFEPTIPVFDQTKTVHGLDRAATVNGMWHTYTVQKSPDNRGFQESRISHLYSVLKTAVLGFMYPHN
jgi:hypothetical protein